ncbi:MAG TPA: M23 family metallopeptidase [Verrucomicrobiae bacterium]|nr:M23 family metallopeptidase [Verrucomicrobiae bacterium]
MRERGGVSFIAAVFAAAILGATTGHALDLCLPTANDALLRPGADAEFFQPTVEGKVESGMFGCVRSQGHRFHKGIDIKCLQRDRRGEPTDPIHAVADGEVAFINARPGLSNYGRYIVLQHNWDGVPVYTLYAHLSEVALGLAAGQPVKKGQVIATMGHSANTKEGISRDRAHLHFEIDLLLSPYFHIWYPKHDPQAPPFGDFNGRNLAGLDPAAFLRAYAANRKLNFAEYVARQPIALTVLVGARPFPWLKLHPEQIQPFQGTPIAYEIGMTAWGLPVAAWPRAAGEISESQHRSLQRGLPVLSRANDAELSQWPCGELVRRSRNGDGWVFTERGEEWVQMLTYVP